MTLITEKPIKPTGNADAVPPEKMKIGKFTCRPFTLQTLIVLEQIGSPLANPTYTDEDGKVYPRPIGMTDIAEAIWAFCNWDRPDCMIIVGDKDRFRNEVAQLAAQLKMTDVPEIQRDLGTIFASINQSMKDAGFDGENGEKKGRTGPSE